MATFVIGDIHGAFKALKQVLEKSKFDYENDTLICLGDVCDGWSEVPECIEELLKIKKLIYILGNHDQWTVQFYSNLLHRDEIETWLYHGGKATYNAYIRVGDELKNKHLNFLKHALMYYVDSNNRAFVHAGIDDLKSALSEQIDYCWTRYFYKNAITWHKQKHNVSVKINNDSEEKVVEWYVGHTPTINFKYGTHNHIKYSNINFMDSGAAFKGFITIMNVDTLEYWQSDECWKLYADEYGRNSVKYNDVKGF